MALQKHNHLLLRTTLSLFDMTARKSEGSKEEDLVKGSLQAKVALSEKKKRPRWVLIEPLILLQWRTHPVGDWLTARRQVFARYLSHFSDLKAFNQLCQGACQSCQTMSSPQYRRGKGGQHEGKSSK